MSFQNDPVPVHLEGDFLVQIQSPSIPCIDLKFEKCSEIKSKITQIKRTMGGEVRPRKWAGNCEYDDVTLEFAATSDPRLRELHRRAKDGIANRGMNPPDYFFETSIVQFAPDKVTRLERKVLHNCYIAEFDEGAGDSENKNPVVRKLVICFWDYDVLPV